MREDRILRELLANGKHFVGNDGAVHCIVWQGQFLKWQVLQPPTRRAKMKPRAQITDFTSAARLRMICELAKINWGKCGRSTFLTLTVPDSLSFNTRKDLTKLRSRFWRSLEKIAGRQLGAFWRIEWKARKSGERVGQLMPHWHFMIFDAPFMAWASVREAWGKLVKFPNVRVELKEMRNAKQAGYYVTKYVAKVEDCYLVNCCISQQRPGGRHWGMLRKNCIPRHEKRTFRIAPGELAQEARDLAVKLRPSIEDYGNESFTLIGAAAVRVGAIILQPHLTTIGERK